MTQERLIRVLSGIGALFVLAVIGVIIFFIRPLPPINIPPPPPLPADNGFDDCVRAAELLEETEKIREIDPAVQPDQARAVLDQNREAMETVRSAFGKGYLTPRPRTWDEEFPYLPGFKNIAQLFVLQGKMRASKGDYPGATESFMDARRFGALVPKGGPMTHRYAGIDMRSTAYSGLESICSRLDEATCRRLLAKLVEVSGSESSFAETLKDESVLALQVLKAALEGKQDSRWGTDLSRMPPRVLRMLGFERAARFVPEYYGEWAKESRKPRYLRRPVKEPGRRPFDVPTAILICGVDEIVARQDTVKIKGELLRIMLALRAFKLRRGVYPAGLSELVPEYLPRIPIDEFDGNPLRYKLTAHDYLLYSVGKDGKDDGGIPAKRADGKELGDIVAGRMYTRQSKTQTR